VEIEGRGDEVQSAFMMFTFPDDREGVLARNIAAVGAFMRETGWEQGSEWAIAAAQKGQGSKAQSGVAYQASIMKQVSMMTLSAKPK
jgi:hypothetical protein